MSLRSKSREVALQLLFQNDTNKIAVPRKAIGKFVRDRLNDETSEAFALKLYDGVLKSRTDIDALIAKTADKWRLSRMMPVDRNVLRLGTFELLHSDDKTATAIVINEAIELSRRFAGADSPAFVNGILDKIAQSARVVPTAATPPPEPPEMMEPSLPPTAAESPG